MAIHCKKTYYTYVIIDKNPTDQRRFYIGYRGAKGDPYEDIDYMSSSDDLKSSVKKRPKDFYKIILMVHYNKFMAISHEHILQRAFDVVSSPYFYNKSIQTTSGFCYDGAGEKNPMFGIHLFGEKNGMFGKTHTPEAKAKMSKKRKARNMEKQSGANHYKARNDITVEKILDLRSQGKTFGEIATIFKCSKVTLFDRLKKC